MDWHEQAQEAEGLQDWDAVIALVSARAECSSADFYAHNNHLWHMDLLARAGRLDELRDLARLDVHARRQLRRMSRQSTDQGGTAPARSVTDQVRR